MGMCDMGCACENCNKQQNLLLHEVSGRPYTTEPMYAQTHPVNTRQLLREAIEEMEEDMGEGTKHDQDKVRTDLLSVPAMLGTASVLTFGAKKYSARNWENGIDYSRVYGALLRHMMAFWEGEDFDPETGLRHLHHAGCCIMFLQQYAELGMTKFDDRPAKAMENEVAR